MLTSSEILGLTVSTVNSAGRSGLVWRQLCLAASREKERYISNSIDIVLMWVDTQFNAAFLFRTEARTTCSPGVDWPKE